MRLLFLFLIGFSTTAHAATILFSDLGTGGSVYSTAPGSIVKGNGPGIGGNPIWQARAFTVSGTGDFSLTQIDLGISRIAGTGTFQASIWTSSSGLPGTELGFWNLSTAVVSGTCCTLTTQSGITGVTLMGGVQYFIVLGPQSPGDSTDDQWAPNTTGALGTQFGSLNGTTYINDGIGDLPAFDVLGDPAASGVPEPGSLILLGTALTGMIAFTRRVKRC